MNTLQLLKKTDALAYRGISSNIKLMLSISPMTLPEIVAMVPDMLIPEAGPAYRWGGNPLGKNMVVLAVLEQMVSDEDIGYHGQSMTYWLRYKFCERLGI